MRCWMGLCGWAALAGAAGLGYVVGEYHHRPGPTIAVAAEPVHDRAVYAPWRNERQASLLEVVDLAGEALQPVAYLPATAEPPLAEALPSPAELQLVRYEAPDIPARDEPGEHPAHPPGSPCPCEPQPLPPSVTGP